MVTTTIEQTREVNEREHQGTARWIAPGLGLPARGPHDGSTRGQGPLWRYWLGVLGAWSLMSIGVPLIAAAPHDWNVVMIVIDDLGWSDLGYAGSDYYESPRIDRLAAESMRFTQAYAAAPVCSPTRAALLTGKHPARLDITIWWEAAVNGGPRDRLLRDAVSKTSLPRSEWTLAELFHAKGYYTAHIGKWHLGDAASYPEVHGYDHHVGGTHWGAPSTFFHPYHGPFAGEGDEFRYVPGLAPGKPGDYLTDRLTDKAVEAIQASGERPFFLTLWHYAVHSPIEAPAAPVEHFRRKQPGQVHREPTYAAMIQRVDHSVGRILDELERRHLRERTLIIFTSDNGGVDIPTRLATPTSNAPLRSGKGTLYEGGLRVPLLVSWPEGVGRGQVCAEPVTSQDLFATLTDVCQLGLPAEASVGNEWPPVDGVSWRPLRDDPTTQLKRSALYWHFPHYYTRMTPSSAVRDGDWKLIHRYEDDVSELYDLSRDPSESHDLASVEPERARQLREQLDAWRASVGANEPTPNR